MAEVDTDGAPPSHTLIGAALLLRPRLRAPA